MQQQAIADLTTQQRQALGFLAHKPWGNPPRRAITWKSLRGRDLVKMTNARPGERGLLLTEDGKAVVAELDKCQGPDRHV